jgi:hypothetical protein
MNSISKRLLAPGLFMFVLGCSVLEPPPTMINAQAEIVAIEKVSDSSVMLITEIFSRGNASMCSFYVYRDTTPISEMHPAYDKRLLIDRANDCNLQDRYEFVLRRIKKNKKYFFRLAVWGSFNIGGPNDTRFDLLGSQAEFTIQ